VSDIRTLLRENRVRYKTVSRLAEGGLSIRFRDGEQRDAGIRLVEDNFQELSITAIDDRPDDFEAQALLIDTALNETRRFAQQQNITTLRKRVNELGVAEPVIQQQGQSRVVVQLPGVQDTARAKEILGATATLEFRMVDEDHDVTDALDGRVPAGSGIYNDRAGQPFLLKKQVMLTGDYIIDAASGIDQLSGGPDVTITLDGKGAGLFSRATRDEVGHRMAVVFIENKTETVEQDGRQVKKKETIEEVINVAVIREQLGKRFHITGLDSTQEARNLALLLRAGALAAPIEIIEERTVGPSLGRDNIQQGFKSVVIGFVLVLLFMAVYYRVFGLIANVALALNLVLLIALLSLLQATLTLPGIAGIVLTVGMAVDANVLIYERIREELRNGNSPQSSIHAGYEKAFSTIADSNITTLIAALVLFGFGTGPIKGFAVTLSLGIICSMFTAIMVTRAIVNFLYGGRRLKGLPV
ncbi:MAG: protein translocase subunit SecD, partial [Gammaproteobacteria bacterium]|nr:protein translocase subunit SecD [Gammaproteobacteria bacterium]